jgi:hypothetical protein
MRIFGDLFVELLVSFGLALGRFGGHRDVRHFLPGGEIVLKGHQAMKV